MPRTPRASEGASFALPMGGSLYIGPGPVKGSAPVLALNEHGETHMLANFHNATTAEHLMQVFIDMIEMAQAVADSPSGDPVSEDTRRTLDEQPTRGES